MGSEEIDLSIIILSYNVRSFLEQSVRTALDASFGLNVEIYVVDNSSSDGSADMVEKLFPQVKLIRNPENFGFAKGNNVAISRAKGRYILLQNPDTILQRDTLRKMVSFMDEHPEAGAVGCKILNPDGTLQLSCRRSFPTPGVAFFKIIGLSSLFPKSRIFGRYNLTYLDPDQTHEVDALSGSFMMVRRKTVEEVGLLDETFFMYGEDLDWCYRIKQAGWKIYYYPGTEIVHFKGESSKRISKTRNTLAFYRAMYIFVKKHLRGEYRLFPVWFLTLGIAISGLVSWIAKVLAKFAAPIFDFILVCLGLTLGIAVRFGGGTPLPKYTRGEWILIYLVVSSIWLIVFSALGLYSRNKYSPTRALLGVFIGFLCVYSIFYSTVGRAVTFFKKEYAFSRLAIIFSWIFNSVFVAGWRAVVHLISRKAKTRVGRRRALVVGTGREAISFVKFLEDHPEFELDVVGLISDRGEIRGSRVNDVRILGLLEDLQEVVHDYGVDEVIISGPDTTYSQIFKMTSDFKKAVPEFKLLLSSFSPDGVDPAAGLPLIDIEYPGRKGIWRRLGGVI